MDDRTLHAGAAMASTWAVSLSCRPVLVVVLVLLAASRIARGQSVVDAPLHIRHPQLTRTLPLRRPI